MVKLSRRSLKVAVFQRKCWKQMPFVLFDRQITDVWNTLEYELLFGTSHWVCEIVCFYLTVHIMFCLFLLKTSGFQSIDTWPSGTGDWTTKCRVISFLSLCANLEMKMWLIHRLISLGRVHWMILMLSHRSPVGLVHLYSYLLIYQTLPACFWPLTWPVGSPDFWRVDFVLFELCLDRSLYKGKYLVLLIYLSYTGILLLKTRPAGTTGQNAGFWELNSFHFSWTVVYSIHVIFTVCADYKSYSLIAYQTAWKLIAHKSFLFNENFYAFLIRRKILWLGLETPY